MALDRNSVDVVLKYIAPAVSKYRSSNCFANRHTFTLGVTGLQGSGKSTWAATLATRLTEDFGYKVIALSLDDFYHDHDNLVRLRESDPSNMLLRTRGQPGSHDTQLANTFFSSLHSPKPGSDTLAIPSFDKSQFSGEGDRAPSEEWKRVSMSPLPDVVIFEGWCVGFQPISEDEVRRKWDAAKMSEEQAGENVEYKTTTLQRHSLEHLLAVNNSLAQYCEAFMGPAHFDYLVHLDTDDIVNVYRWRIGQEKALHKSKGKGMTDEGVVRFVQGYMPSYELYLDQLRESPFFKDKSWNMGKSNHLRLILDGERAICRFHEQ